LFHRSTRSIRLTEKGEIFLPHAERILQAAADAQDLLREGDAAFAGRIRVACSIAVARRLLGENPWKSFGQSNFEVIPYQGLEHQQCWVNSLAAQIFESLISEPRELPREPRCVHTPQIRRFLW